MFMNNQDANSKGLSKFNVIISICCIIIRSALLHPRPDYGKSYIKKLNSTGNIDNIKKKFRLRWNLRIYLPQVLKLTLIFMNRCIETQISRRDHLKYYIHNYIPEKEVNSKATSISTVNSKTNKQCLDYRHFWRIITYLTIIWEKNIIYSRKRNVIIILNAEKT